MREIDARGLACPAPVLQTKATLQEEQSGSVKVIVDNAAAQQNVQRFLESQGFQTALEQHGSDYLVIGTCGVQQKPQAQPSSEEKVDVKKIMVMCATDRIGFGDDELGPGRPRPGARRGDRSPEEMAGSRAAACRIRA